MLGGFGAGAVAALEADTLGAEPGAEHQGVVVALAIGEAGQVLGGAGGFEETDDPGALAGEVGAEAGIIGVGEEVRQLDASPGAEAGEDGVGEVAIIAKGAGG